MSRHTKLDKDLSRVALDQAPGMEDYNLIVYLEPEGKARLVAEPLERRIKRNEQLPTVHLDLGALFEAGVKQEAVNESSEPAEVSSTGTSLEPHIQRILNKLAITFHDDDKQLYFAKMALIAAVRQEFDMPIHKERK